MLGFDALANFPLAGSPSASGVIASLAATEAADTASFALTATHTATLAATEAADTASFAATGPASAYPQILTTNTYAGAANTTHALNLPTGITSGDKLLLFVVMNGTPTVTDPTGWTVLDSQVTSKTYKIYVRDADGTEGSTATLTLSSSVAVAANAYRVSGAASGLTSSSIAFAGPVSASTATPDPPSLTPTWGSAADLWFAVAFAGTNYANSAYPSGYTLGQLTTIVASAVGVSSAANQVTAATEDPGTFTQGNANPRLAYTIALRPGAVSMTLAATESADVAAFSAYAAPQAVLAATEALDVAAFTLAPVITATLAATEAPDTAAFTLAPVITATLAAAEAPDVANFQTGTVATLAATEAADTASFALTAAHTAALAATEAPDTAAFVVLPALTAVLAATEAPDVAAFVASPPAAVTPPGYIRRRRQPPPPLPAPTPTPMAEVVISEEVLRQIEAERYAAIELARKKEALERVESWDRPQPGRVTKSISLTPPGSPPPLGTAARMLAALGEDPLADPRVKVITLRRDPPPQPAAPPPARNVVSLRGWNPPAATPAKAKNTLIRLSSDRLRKTG